MDIKTLNILYKAAAASAIDEVEYEDSKTRIKMRLQAVSAKDSLKSLPASSLQQPAAASASSALDNKLSLLSSLNPGQIAPAEAGKSSGSIGKEIPSAQDEAAEKFDLVSPEIGFFSRYNPVSKKQYVKLRDKLKKGDIVGIVVSMHVVYEVRTERNGKLVEFLVEENQPVEYHQPVARFLP